MKDSEARAKSEKWLMGRELPKDLQKIVEGAYRRGYQHGAAETLYSLEDGATLRELHHWVETTLSEWRYRVSLISRQDAPPLTNAAKGNQ